VEITTPEIKDFLFQRQGLEVTLAGIRKEFNILPGTQSFDTVRNIMFQLAEQKVVSPSGKKDGIYKVIRKVTPIQVFGIEREDRPPFELIFPRDFDTMMEMAFANDIVVREGDIILIAGMSNYFKTGLCLNLCGENIDKHPVLMGNEFSIITETGFDVSPRLHNRMRAMSEWIEWADGDGRDKFELLPVWDDYAENIKKDRINIIDWINLPGEYYMISSVMENIKKAIGRGIGILVIQKNEGVTHGIGGGRSVEFADLEIRLDNFGKDDILLTIGKVKESKAPVTGKTYAFHVVRGVKIINFREVKKCPQCHGQGYIKGQECDDCFGNKWVDK